MLIDIFNNKKQIKKVLEKISKKSDQKQIQLHNTLILWDNQYKIIKLLEQQGGNQ